MRCYLLAGGRSRRMGRSKVELFADRVIAAARGAFEEVIAVQRHGGAALSIPTIFEAPHENDGPVFGVLRALQDADGRCFVLAVDYPLITTAILRELRQRFGGRMLVPMWRGRPQMLCGGYSADMREMIERRVRIGRFDLRGLIEEAGAEMIAEDDLRARHAGEPLMNVNTPEELQEIYERFLSP